MTSEKDGYTPTTEQVENAYACGPEHEDYCLNDAEDHDENRRRFRRWLAKHDSETRAADREALANELELSAEELEARRPDPFSGLSQERSWNMSEQRRFRKQAKWLREKAKESRDDK